MTASAPHALSELELPFPGATGRGVKIAVIDSGVNVNHPHIIAPIQPVFLDSFTGERSITEERSIEDNAGHGTAVTAAIQEKAPEAEYFAIKLFGRSLRTSATRLTEAIRWSLENRMNIVNLSLGTTNPGAWRELQELAELAREAGVLLISARSASPEPALPGALPEVIGVDVDWELPRQRYRAGAASDSQLFLASGFPRPLPGMDPARNLHGISFAVANMSGFAARAYQTVGGGTLSSVCDALTRESHRLAVQQT
jgi:subtilisin family serine protease